MVTFVLGVCFTPIGPISLSFKSKARTTPIDLELKPNHTHKSKHQARTTHTHTRANIKQEPHTHTRANIKQEPHTHTHKQTSSKNKNEWLLVWWCGYCFLGAEMLFSSCIKLNGFLCVHEQELHNGSRLDTSIIEH